MAKQPTKNIPQAKPAQATVKTTAKPKTSTESWFRLPSSQNTTVVRQDQLPDSWSRCFTDYNRFLFDERWQHRSKCV